MAKLTNCFATILWRLYFCGDWFVDASTLRSDIICANQLWNFNLIWKVWWKHFSECFVNLNTSRICEDVTDENILIYLKRRSYLSSCKRDFLIILCRQLTVGLLRLLNGFILKVYLLSRSFYRTYAGIDMNFLFVRRLYRRCVYAK